MKTLPRGRPRPAIPGSMLALLLLGGCASAGYSSVPAGTTRENCIVLDTIRTYDQEFTCIDGGADDECWISLDLSNTYVMHFSRTVVGVPEGQTAVLHSGIYGNSVGTVDVSFSDEQGQPAFLYTLEVARSCS